MGRPKGSKNKPKESTASETPAEATPSPEVTEDQDRPNPAQPAFKNRLSLIEDVNTHNREQQQEEDEAERNSESDDVDQTEEDQSATSSEDSIGKPEEENPEAEKQSEPAKDVPPNTPLVGKHKLIIDGVEKELTFDEVKALAQKAGAVDSRLAEATRLLESAKQNATRQDATSAKPTHQPSSDVDETGEVVEELTQAIVYGDQDQVRTALTRILTGRPAQPSGSATTQMSPQQIQHQIIETMAFQNAQAKFAIPADQGGYKDIWDDPMMKQMFLNQENQLRDGGDKRPYTELYDHIAKDLRTWREGVVKQYAPKTGLENRDSQKRDAAIVHGAGGKPPTPAQPRPVTHEGTLESMRRSRGLN